MKNEIIGVMGFDYKSSQGGILICSIYIVFLLSLFFLQDPAPLGKFDLSSGTVRKQVEKADKPYCFQVLLSDGV